MAVQFLADNIDQLDLALDQLAIKERNFDRFALMLIDNVVELTLHKHAQDRAAENRMSGSASTPTHDPKMVEQALGKFFDAKIKLARATQLLEPNAAETILNLHNFRNAVYHQGLRHEGILHSLAIFYFENACLLLSRYAPAWWIYGRDKISHRAMKYLGGLERFGDKRPRFEAAWKRLGEVAKSMGDTLVADLCTDMAKTIEETDEQIKFLAENSQTPSSRKQVIVDSQAWQLAFTEEGKIFFRDHKCPETSVGGMVEWLGTSYPWQVKDDPIPSWLSRLESLKTEKDNHVAIKKYCDFVKQTDELRARILESAAQLDAHIEAEGERMREERAFNASDVPK